MHLFTELHTMVEKYSEVFSKDLGIIKPFQAKLFLKKGTTVNSNSAVLDQYPMR